MNRVILHALLTAELEYHIARHGAKYRGAGQKRNIQNPFILHPTSITSFFGSSTVKDWLASIRRATKTLHWRSERNS